MVSTNDHSRRAPGLLILKVVAVALIGLIERREMVYIHSWQEYQDAAEALYETSPNKVCDCRARLPAQGFNLSNANSQTRYCVKWRAAEGKLVLKITDDTRVRIGQLPVSQTNLTLITSTLKVYQIQNLLLRLPQPIRGTQSITHAKDVQQASGEAHPGISPHSRCRVSASTSRCRWHGRSCINGYASGPSACFYPCTSRDRCARSSSNCCIQWGEEEEGKEEEVKGTFVDHHRSAVGGIA